MELTLGDQNYYYCSSCTGSTRVHNYEYHLGVGNQVVWLCHNTTADAPALSPMVTPHTHTVYECHYTLLAYLLCRYLEKGDREGTELELIRMAAKVRVTMRVPTCVSPSHSCTHTRYPCHLCCLHESYWRLTLLSLTQWTDQKVCLPHTHTHTRAHVHVYTHTQTQTHSLDSPTCGSILKEVVAVWSVST